MVWYGLGFNVECHTVMTFDNLANLMQNWGYEIKSTEYENFSNYLQAMLTKNRVMLIWDKGLISCVIIYFLTNDVENAYKKSTWEVPQDDPDGDKIYVEKMVCSGWSGGLRKLVYEAFKEKFPQVTEVHYHRAPFDRPHKIIIRRENVQSSIS